jgi:hypothetical protein
LILRSVWKIKKNQLSGFSGYSEQLAVPLNPHKWRSSVPKKTEIYQLPGNTFRNTYFLIYIEEVEAEEDFEQRSPLPTV